MALAWALPSLCAGARGC